MGAPEWCIHLLPDALTYSGTAVQLAVLPSPQNKDIRGIAAGRRNLDSRDSGRLVDGDAETQDARLDETD